MTLQLIPYLVMNGSAVEAIRFYETALGAKILFRQMVPEHRRNPAGSQPSESDKAEQGPVKHRQPKSVPTEARSSKPESTGPHPVDATPRVSHATLRIGHSTIMIRDAPPGQPRRAGNQVTIAINTHDVDEARRMFAELTKGGRVGAPLRATPFSLAHGLVTDKFGVPFQITAQPTE